MHSRGSVSKAGMMSGRVEIDVRRWFVLGDALQFGAAVRNS